MDNIRKRKARMRAGALATLLLGGALCLNGCASDIGDSASETIDGENSSYLHFKMSINSNGSVDHSGVGCYIILLNSMAEAIEVTDTDTFTDFIKYDGVNFDWYTRQANQPNPGFTFAMAGSLNTEGSISNNGQTIDITFNLADGSSLLHQYMTASTFTAHAITTDAFEDADIGRVLDVLGNGLTGNSLQTVLVNKKQGAISPYPSYYPNDNLEDWLEQPDLSATFPYVNFDIDTFQITQTLRRY